MEAKLLSVNDKELFAKHYAQLRNDGWTPVSEMSTVFDHQKEVVFSMLFER